MDKRQVIVAMAEKWREMNEDEKKVKYLIRNLSTSLFKPYLDAAQQEKANYEQKLQEYKLTDDYKNFIGENFLIRETYSAHFRT